MKQFIHKERRKDIKWAQQIKIVKVNLKPNMSNNIFSINGHIFAIKIGQ